MDVTESSILIDLMLWQLLKQLVPNLISARLFLPKRNGSVASIMHRNTKSSKASHPLNAEFPMVVRLSGNVTDVRFLQPVNALSPMLNTPSGIVIDSRLSQLPNANEGMDVSQQNCISYSPPAGPAVTSLSHLLNALFPIFFAPSGNTIDVSPAHPKKAFSPILVIVSGISTVANPSHNENA